MAQVATKPDLPVWARRLRAERTARGWSDGKAVQAMRAHAAERLPADSTLLRNWKRWEAGSCEPDGFHKSLIARTFGTVTAAFFRRRHRVTLRPRSSPPRAWRRWRFSLG